MTSVVTVHLYAVGLRIAINLYDCADLLDAITYRFRYQVLQGVAVSPDVVLDVSRHHNIRYTAHGRSAIIPFSIDSFPTIDDIVKIVIAARRPDLLFLHASSVCYGERAAILVGPSGTGKTTLAGYLAGEHGCQLLSDDFTVLDCTSRSIIPFRTGPTIRQFPNDESIACKIRHAYETCSELTSSKKISLIAFLSLTTDIESTHGEPSLWRVLSAIAPDQECGPVFRGPYLQPRSLSRPIHVIQSLINMTYLSGINDLSDRMTFYASLLENIKVISVERQALASMRDIIFHEIGR